MTDRHLRVLVCGGRDFEDYWLLRDTLDELHRRAPHDCMVVIQGGARGADTMARRWCGYRMVRCDHFPADWSTHGRAAGAIRNAQMLREGKPDLVIAFEGGRGTADMVRRARAAGIEVREIRRG